MARRPSFGIAEPQSPSSTLPELALLPAPLHPTAIPVGQLVSKSSKLDPTALEDRDYDDVGGRWYKDVIVVNDKTGRFVEGLGASFFVQQPASGNSVGTIEAPEMRVRLLKDPSLSLRKMLDDPKTRDWVEKEQHAGREVGIVTARREVTNASYKRARLVDVGNNQYKVEREVGGEGEGGKRRDSGLTVDTGSKVDVVGVEVRRVEMLVGDVLEKADFWASS